MYWKSNLILYILANLKSVFKSWEQQNLEESRILIQHLSAYPRTIVMGDLNSSPTVPSKRIQGDFEGIVTDSILLSI